jgi:hypothetical protein
MTQNSPVAQCLRWQLPSERASLAIGIGGLLFPMLLGVDLLVGMVNEPRMFNAFIPVLVAVLLTALQRMVILERGPKLQSSAVSEDPA